MDTQSNIRNKRARIIHSGVLDPMPRGYRCIILAVVGWLSLAAGPAPNKSARAEHPKSRANIEQSLATIANAQAEAVEQAKPSEYQRPCDPGKDNRASDLCAQWQAAVAARDAAKWAFWSFILGIGGTVGLLATLYYTREAVRIAGEATKDADTALAIAARNADAAAAQVEVARDTAQHQLRAYLYPGRATLELSILKIASHYSIEIVMLNTGATPATLTLYQAVIKMCSPQTVPSSLAGGSRFLTIHEVKTNIQKVVGPHNETHLSFGGNVPPIYFDHSIPHKPGGLGEHRTEINIELEWSYRDYLGRTWDEYAVFTSDNIKWDCLSAIAIKMRQSRAKSARYPKGGKN